MRPRCCRGQEHDDIREQCVGAEERHLGKEVHHRSTWAHNDSVMKATTEQRTSGL